MSNGLKPSTMLHGTVIQSAGLSHRKHPQQQQLLWPQSQAPGMADGQSTGTGLQCTVWLNCQHGAYRKLACWLLPGNVRDTTQKFRVDCPSRDSEFTNCNKREPVDKTLFSCLREDCTVHEFICMSSLMIAHVTPHLWETCCDTVS